MRYPVTIRVNGESLEIAGRVTISGLLANLTIDSRLVAVEHNLIVVKRDKYESVVLQEGDEVEIVNFVGGG
jgi:sulfur carrier protein